MINRSAYGIQQSEIPRTELAIITVIYFISPPPRTLTQSVMRGLWRLGANPKKDHFRKWILILLSLFWLSERAGPTFCFRGWERSPQTKHDFDTSRVRWENYYFSLWCCSTKRSVFRPFPLEGRKELFQINLRWRSPPSANSLWFYEIWRAWEWSSHRCSSIIADFGRKPRLVSIDTRAALCNVLICDVYLRSLFGAVNLIVGWRIKSQICHCRLLQFGIKNYKIVYAQ